MPTFKGRTEDASAPFLGADFWKRGVKVIGKVLRTFKSANGLCYAIKLAGPVKLNGKTYDEVSIGGLKGFDMALQAAGIECLKAGDGVYIECTGSVETTKSHERVNFCVEVSRPDCPTAQATGDDIPS